MTSLAGLLFDGGVEGESDADRAALLVHAAGEDFSLGEVRDRATAVAAALGEAGIGPGVPVGVMLPNAAVVATLFGVWRAEGAYVPLNPRLGAADLAQVLAAVEPAAVVTTQEHAGRFGDRPTILVDGTGALVTAGPARPAGARDETPRRFDPDVALVQLTSGTTGRPKPVLLRHSGVRTLLDNVISTLRGGRPDAGGAGRGTGSTGGGGAMPNLIPVSLSLWAGIYQVLFARLVGAPVVVMDAFEPRAFADLVARFGIRSTVLPPAAMATLTDAHEVTTLEPLRYVRSITAPLSPLQARRFRERFDVAVLNCYGQTEIGGEIVGWSAADWKAHGDAKLGAVGRPHAGVEVRRDEGTGELQVRTPALSAGYADGGDLSDRLTADGWFRTGDVGHVDQDGFVWIDGRVSDMINRGGLKVFPAEVEEVLRLSGDVADVAVVGLPDDRLGEVPWAFVVAAAGATVEAGALEDLCRAHLAPYKVPVRFHPVAGLPRNEVGKVLTRELVAAARP